MEKQYLFIIWEKARHLEDEILNRIAKQFKILKKIAIKWDEDKFHDNIYSFCGGCLVNSDFHEEHKGKGEFLVVLIEDENENLELRQTAQGEMLVNKNVFDFKYNTRKEILDNKCSLHVSNNLKETRHDFALLTGQSLKDFCASTPLDGELVSLKQNLPCVDGWKSLEQVFYILNETVDYAVLRSFQELPLSTDNDVDLLVDDLQNLISVLKGSKLRELVIDNFVWTKVENENILFHAQFIGDDNLDSNFQKEILNTRILNENNVYIPNNENWFYSLLYYVLYYKNHIKDSHFETLGKLSSKLNINEELNFERLKIILTSYLKKKNYKIPIPANINLQGLNNVIDKNLIKDIEKYYIVKGVNGISIFNTKLIGIDKKVINQFFFFDEKNRFSPFVNFLGNLHTINNCELERYKKHIKPNTLFITFRKRFGHVVTTELLEKQGKFELAKKWITYPFKYFYTDYFKIFTREKHDYYRGTVLSEHIKGIDANQNEVEKMLEVFISTVFEKFKLKNGKYLASKAFDVTTDNCLINEENQELTFFDFEFELRVPLEKSYLLYRICKYCQRDGNDKYWYDLFCNKLMLENKYYYWEKFEGNIFKDLPELPNDGKRYIKLVSCLIPSKKYRKRFRDKNHSRQYRQYMKIFN